jgi:eukaryotic-like serine/threonine-protein kinase
MLRAGDAVGRYLIERRLGHGGMGTLYLAHDPVLDRAIALKLLLGDIDSPGARERFVREARAAAALSNPNIVTIYDYGDYESQPYIVMEYIHGETLADVIRRRPEMPIAIKLRWAEELCSAVGYAHARGIIHRDIKPANLMIDSYGQLKVLDFGIARMRGTLATNATALVGTPGYCAPEQIRGGQIDHRSDVFSIGAVCYELLSYTEAFGGDTVHVITNRILNEEPLPLSRACEGIDGELEGVVMKALQKPVDERFASADALCKALADVRVRLESDSDMTIRYVSPIAALPPRQLTPASGIPSPGRPCTNRGSRDAAVTVMTPSPDPRRTDRENEARRRVVLVREHLTDARKRLNAGDLQAARAACDEALKLDNKHPEALALLAEVDASREHAVTEWIAEARQGLSRGDTIAVADLIDRVNKLEPDHPATASLARDLRLLRADQEHARRRANTFAAAIAAAEAALAGNDLDEALARAREALSIDPSSQRALALQEEALRPPQQSQTAGAQAAVRPDVRTETPRTSPRLVRSWYRWAISAAAALIVLAAAIGTFLWRSAPATPSLVVLDAAPWATIVSVRREEGPPLILPEAASTPLALRLDPGEYRVVLQGPPPELEQRTISIHVEAGMPTAVPAQKFVAMSAEEYFRQYLSPSAPVVEPEEPVGKVSP